VTSKTQALQLKVGQTLQDFWENYAGNRPDRAIVVINQQAITVLLEGVLTPAEQRVVGTEAGRLTLKKFSEHIMEQAGPHWQQIVSEIVGEDVSLVKIDLDVVRGTILGFFLR
jgi:uncharacterized protein YbcI